MAAIKGNWYASAGLPNEAYPQSDDTVRFVYADQPNGERYIVAKVWAGDDQDYEGTARLVAAAPELLAACRGMVDAFDRGDAADEQVALRSLRAAIAKAEGRDE